MTPSPEADAPEATVPDPKPPVKPRHTAAQRLVLAVNVLVIIGCFAGASALIVGKNVREDFQAAPSVSIDTASTVPAAGGDDTAETAPVDTGPGETFAPADPEAKNFLVVGDDSNACVDPDSPWAGAADPGRDGIGQRSDTIMVLRVEPATSQAVVLSFPRDLWVKIPGRGKNRINSAYEKGDYSVLAQTIFDNFGILVDHYLQIDFCAFKTIVDAVGGVSVPFATPIRDKQVGINILEAGCHRFSGDEALAYVRSRHLEYLNDKGRYTEDASSDLGRISRQQDFLLRTLQAALDKGLDVKLARGVLKTVQNYVVFDQGFSTEDALKFVGVLTRIDPTAVTTYQIEASRLLLPGADVLEPKLKGENMQAIIAIFQGAPIAGAVVQSPETASTATSSATTPTTATTAPTTTATAGPASTTTATTSVSPATTSVAPVAAPEIEVIGDIVPDRNIRC
jgi:LCP family protein required for cell wall assembly